MFLLKEIRNLYLKESKKALFALLRLKLCLVLFRVRLLSNFKNDQNIELLRLNLCILNLLPL